VKILQLSLCPSLLHTYLIGRRRRAADKVRHSLLSGALESASASPPFFRSDRDRGSRVTRILAEGAKSSSDCPRTALSPLLYAFALLVGADKREPNTHVAGHQ
jgi:hypothetical protein